MSNEDPIYTLGRIDGKLDAIHEEVAKHTGKISSIDERLRKLETRAAVHGAAGGAVVAVGVALLVEKLKRTFGG